MGFHGAPILRNSTLYFQAESNNLLNEPTNVIDGLKVRLLLIGDGAYRACTWFVKSHPNNANLSPEEKLFSKSLCSARVKVEWAFCILKAR